jgi:CHAT domain-containing protein/tetratricopeptide (TPR) repeat protein
LTIGVRVFPKSKEITCFVGYVTVSLIFAMTGGQLAPQTHAQSTQTETTTLLRSEQLIERELAGGQTHIYRVEADAGDFLQIRVEQKGVDVLLKLLDTAEAGGKSLAEMDSPNKKDGPETLSFVATFAGGSSGSYTLQVISFGAQGEKGNYTIRREASRKATAGDKRRVEVERAFVEGMTLRETRAKKRTTIAKLEESLRGWEELQDSYMAEMTARQVKQLKEPPAYLKDSPVDTLRIGEATTLDLKGGEVHSYPIDLVQGQILRADLEEKGVNVRIELIRVADYEVVAKADFGSGYDREMFTYLVDQSGKYIFAVLGLRTPLSGSTQFQVRLSQSATDVDRQRITAERLLVEGQVSRDDGSAEGLRGAVTKFSQSLPLWETLGEKYWEGYTRNVLGLVYSDLGENKRALEFYNQALPLRRAVGDRKGEAATLSNLGASYSLLSQQQKALEFYEQALPLWREVGNRQGEVETLSSMGVVHSHLGNNQKALESLNEALPLSRALGGRQMEAETLGNIGAVYLALGKGKKALEFYGQGLLVSRAIRDRRMEATTLNNMGSIHSSLGEQQKALEFYNQALPLRRAVGDRRGEAITLMNMGGVHADLGERQKALELYNQALPVFRAVGDRSGEAITLNNIGFAYSGLGQEQKALEFYNQALPLRRAVGDRSGEATTLDNLMSVWESLNNRRLAILYGKQSVNVYQGLRADIQGLEKELQQSFLGTVKYTYRRVAELLIKEGRLPEAERVLEMLKEEEYFQFVRRDGNLAATLNRRITLSPSEQEALGRYEKIADEITKLGDEYTRLDAERLRAPAGGATAVIAQQELLNKRLADARTALQLYLEALKKEFSQEDKRVAAVEEGLQSDVKSWADPHAVVISTIVGKDNLSIIVTTSDIQRAHVIEISEERLNALIAEFRGAIMDPQTDPHPAGQKLYDLLLKPLEKDLAGVQARTLVWSLDGNLRYIPVAALWDKDRGYLVQRYANVVITLASRQNLALRPAHKKEWQVLGLGVSKAVGGFNQLSYVPQELRAIVREATASPRAGETGVIAGRRLLDEQFTYSAFRSYLGRYPLVHAATHFSFVPGTKDEALESFLLLGNGERLTLAQIQSSGTIFDGVQLLTLSACDTAYGGKDADGREVEGFGAMAQKKGAKAVMATLWRVADESTSDLMVSFYKLYERDGFTKAEALRQAQLSLLQEADQMVSVVANARATAKSGAAARGVNKPALPNNSQKRYTHPYYWAPFILIGNWW